MKRTRLIPTVGISAILALQMACNSVDPLSPEVLGSGTLKITRMADEATLGRIWTEEGTSSLSFTATSSQLKEGSVLVHGMGKGRAAYDASGGGCTSNVGQWQVDYVISGFLDTDPVCRLDLLVETKWTKGMAFAVCFGIVDVTNPRAPQTLGFFAVKDLPSIGDILITPDLSVILSSEISLTGGGKAVIIGGLSSIGFGPMRLFVADNALTSIGSRMALTDDGILVSTDRVYATVTTSENGVHTAALGSLVYITSVTPPLVAVDESGVTTQPIMVKYRLLAPPPDATSGQIKLVRQVPGTTGATTLGTYAMDKLEDGSYSLTVPAGVQMNVPSDEVQIAITVPGGDAMSPVYATINSADEVAQATSEGGGTASELVEASFEDLSPKYVMRGSGDVQVTVTGTNVLGVTNAQVRGADGAWSELETSSRTATSLTFKLPAALLMAEGFLQVSPIQDERHALAFLVAAPGLPAPGTSADIVLAQSDPSDLGWGGQTLTVEGETFAAGMSVVLGRGSVPGLKLTTTFVSDVELAADLPPAYLGQADDLFVAVLSADGQSLSGPVALTSTSSDFSMSVAQQYLDRQEQDGDTPPPTVTSVLADLLWNVDNQKVEIEGVGLTSAPAVVLQTASGTYNAAVEAVSTAASLLPDSVTRWLAKIPAAVVSHPLFSFQATVARGTQAALQSGPAPAGVITPFKIPLGGRGRFLAYAHNLTSPEGPWKLILAQQDGSRVRQIRPYAGNLRDKMELVSGATFSVSDNENPAKPSGLRVVQPEKDPADTQSFYLRGTGLTDGVGLAKLHVKYGAIEDQRDIAVVRKAVGTPKKYKTLWNQHLADVRRGNFPSHDKEIIEAADQYGVPPQYLKAQALRESTGFQYNFRYEPLTRDYAYMTGDDPTEMSSPAGTPWIATPPLSLYSVGGRRLLAPTPQANWRQRTFTNADVDAGIGPTFELGESVMRGYGKPTPKPNPSNASMLDPRVMAVITGNGKTQKLTLSSNYPIWRKGRRPHDKAPTGVLEPAHGINSKMFSVNFASGTVTIGRTLQKGETLTVGYDAAAPDNWQEIQPGALATFTLMATDTNSHRIVREHIEHEFLQGQSLSEWFQRNLRYKGTTPRRYGAWLTGTDSETQLEFTVAPNTNQPDQPLDQRYWGMTAQPYTSSAYGALQVQMDEWAGSRLDTARQNALIRTLDIRSMPVFTLFTDWKKGVELGAAIHQTKYQSLQQATPSQICNPCTRPQWKAQWDAIMLSYSRKGDGYKNGEIMQYAKDLEPR